MFSGLIQGLGEITARNSESSEMRFTIRALFDHSPWINGESIAINGVCLSVERHDRDSFTVYASTETLTHTTLGSLMGGAKVNLERALALGERLGGHLVSGHVDCVAEVTEISSAGQSLKVRINFPELFSDQVIERGSITLDGISLTVTACGAGFLTVNIIPDSQKRTNVSAWQKGTRLNMETDLIGKYVCRYLETHMGKNADKVKRESLNRDFLARNGFL